MERTIEISVRDRIAWQTNKEEYICGNGDFAVVFAFDQEWDEAAVKTARFVHGGQHTDIVFTGTRCEVPVILDTKQMKVGVYAGDLKTTTPATVGCKNGILCGGGLPADPAPDVYAQIMEEISKIKNGEAIAASAWITNVALPSAAWVGNDGLYSQVVKIDGITPFSKVDLLPSVEQLAIFHSKDVAFVTENENGVVTVYAIGDKPLLDYTVQAQITEVAV